MLKVGLIGLGGISSSHVSAWKEVEGAELVAGCDIRPEQFAAYPELRHYTDFHDMLEHEELDILDVCLPTYLHAKFAVEAMNRGIHVICEKPISLEVSDVDLLYSTAEKNGVKFMVAQVIRFWPEYLLLKEIYDTKRYGELLSGEMERMGGYPKWSWENWMMDETRSGSVPFDLHIHDLDFMIYTFGKPSSVNHFRSKRPGQDYIQVVYTFPTFSIDIKAAWYASDYPFHMDFRFQFENAVVAYENGTLSIYQRDGRVVCPFQESGNSEFSEIPQSSGYANEIRYFAECVRDDRPQTIVKQEEMETDLRILKGIH